MSGEDPFPQFETAAARAQEVEPEPWVPPAAEPVSKFFEADDGARLHYLDWPAKPGAPLVLMVHGRRAHSRWFDSTVSGLMPDYHCLALDLRNHGESGGIEGESFSLARYAMDVAQFIALFPGKRIILLLHSMAGRLGIMAHQRHGARFDLLVMADTPIQRRPHHLRPEPLMRPKSYPSKEAALARFRLMPPGSIASPELLRDLAEHSITQNEDGSWTWKFDEGGSSRPGGIDFPSAEELDLEAIDCPTLVIYGEHSTLVTAEEAEAMARRFPKGELAGLRGTHHHLMLDRPRGFSDALRDFFRAHGF